MSDAPSYPGLDLAAIDAFLDSVGTATSDDHMRQLFSTYNATYDRNMPADPFSAEYRDRVMQMYAFLNGRQYDTSHEVTPFDPEEFAARPFPYSTNSASTVGNHLMAMGFLIRTLADIPPGGKVLDCGIGWGNTTMAMAKSGFDVTAIDVDDNFIELVRRRSELEKTPVEIIKGDFTEVMSDLADAGRQFDAVVFFESFHHSADHHNLIAAISRVVAQNGMILFATEAIYDDFPIPWGLRMDGESLWAIRQNGWMELGFNSDYFDELLKRHGWVGTFLDARKVSATAYAIVARRLDEITTEWTYDSGLHHNVGARTSTGVTTNATAGALAFGPYASLPKGRWSFEIEHDTSVIRPFGNLVVELACDTGATILGRQLIRLLPLRRGPIRAEFVLSKAVADLEIRLHVGQRSRLHVTGIKAHVLD